MAYLRDDMAQKYRDEDGNEFTIDERFFMEWVNLGLAEMLSRLAAETKMDEIDKRKQEGGE